MRVTDTLDRRHNSWEFTGTNQHALMVMQSASHFS